VLVELKAVEQRYRAVIDVLDGMSVTDVARRNNVTRQSVHTWLRRYAEGGMAALADKSSKPESCPHQMAPVIEARVVELRRAHPRWGPRSIRTQLAKEGFTPLPGLSSIYRTLVRHHLLEPTQRKRTRSDYKRWERSRSMELWQMDIVGRFHLADATEVKVVTGVDDHSRFCVCARVVARATARPVCEALQWALRTHGVPDQILTDNGKVFTARFGQGPGPVLFDRICANNGIRHLLTAPFSPTTTGKVERFHKTMRSDFLVDHDQVHDSIGELQRALDEWVDEYNTERPHQSLGDRPPAERFALAPSTEQPTSRCQRSKSPSLCLHVLVGSTAGSTNEDRSASGACAIGWGPPSPVSPSRWWCARAWSRSSTPAFSSPPTPNEAVRRQRELALNALLGPDVPVCPPPA
jgi:transposase InsO family protein